MREPITFLGVPMHPWSMAETVTEIERRLRNGRFIQHGVVNVAKVVAMQDNRDLFDAIASCDIINIDGMGVVWGARFMGHMIPERVGGIDLFHKLLEMAERTGDSVYFLGAKEGVIDTAVAKLQARYPRLNVAGYHHGYFWEDEEAMVREIGASGASLLFVAISPPKKEIFIAKWGDRLNVKFAMGVGGTLDVVAGKTKRAPLWMQRWGLEWFFRFLQEPRRMFWRYFSSNSRFALLLLKARLAKLFSRRATAAADQ
ncbi:WecB/TagA/CpsF family glycosyltransferase [Magnetofaba australis]|uniref:Putative N-acetylmannosaminyltransferase n=1 Tax=Magnetofaba australis IT-1 TaxID=1434232 RepID=A0A1Y2KBC4_9PROT|nr:WecB/TagA/CpsF family glycosyltransferase [Magnetofaba australis]OSM07115.1 putative N-acetylmannosaminyltransferase [Magnetofaba australis IT-1]